VRTGWKPLFRAKGASFFSSLSKIGNGIADPSACDHSWPSATITRIERNCSFPAMLHNLRCAWSMGSSKKTSQRQYLGETYDGKQTEISYETAKKRFPAEVEELYKENSDFRHVVDASQLPARQTKKPKRNLISTKKDMYQYEKGLCGDLNQV
jgi:hypothetical protein